MRIRVIVLTAFLATLAVPVGFAQVGAVACGDGVAPTSRPAIRGEGWGTYCLPCVWANRTFGRVEVIETLEDALTAASQAHPGTEFLYGEIGFPSGGAFPPHRTHREGLSVDIMVPLEDGAVLPTHPGNRFGYDEEFDDKGRGEAGRIDFAALAQLITELAQGAEARGGSIRRIYFAPDLQPALFATAQGADLPARIRFNTKEAWVRHDDHFHVDFAFACP